MKVEGYYLPEKKLSKVVITNKKGKTYIGISYLHPDDTPNEIVGCTIAEMRAQRERLKDKRDETRIKMQTLISTRKEYLDKYHPIFYENEVRFLDTKIKYYRKQLTKIIDDINKLKKQEKDYKALKEKIKTKYIKKVH